MLLPLCLHLKVCSPVAVTTVTMVEHALTTPVTAHLSPLVFTVNTLVVSMLCTNWCQLSPRNISFTPCIYSCTQYMTPKT